MERLITGDTCPNCGSYRTIWWTREDAPNAEPVRVRRECAGGCTEQEMDAAEAALGS